MGAPRSGLREGTGGTQRDAQITSRTNAGGNARRIEMRVLAARTSRRRILNSVRNVCLGRE